MSWSLLITEIIDAVFQMLSEVPMAVLWLRIRLFLIITTVDDGFLWITEVTLCVLLVSSMFYFIFYFLLFDVLL